MEEVYCNICEELVGEAATLDKVGGLEEVALWNGGHTGDISGATVVCNGCVTYGYELMKSLQKKRGVSPTELLMGAESAQDGVNE